MNICGFAEFPPSPSEVQGSRRISVSSVATSRDIKDTNVRTVVTYEEPVVEGEEYLRGDTDLDCKCWW